MTKRLNLLLPESKHSPASECFVRRVPNLSSHPTVRRDERNSKIIQLLSISVCTSKSPTYTSQSFREYAQEPTAGINVVQPEPVYILISRLICYRHHYQGVHFVRVFHGKKHHWVLVDGLEPRPVP